MEGLSAQRLTVGLEKVYRLLVWMIEGNWLRGVEELVDTSTHLFLFGHLKTIQLVQTSSFKPVLDKDGSGLGLKI